MKIKFKHKFSNKAKIKRKHEKLNQHSTNTLISKKIGKKECWNIVVLMIKTLSFVPDTFLIFKVWQKWMS